MYEHRYARARTKCAMVILAILRNKSSEIIYAYEAAKEYTVTINCLIRQLFRKSLNLHSLLLAVINNERDIISNS